MNRKWFAAGAVVLSLASTPAFSQGIEIGPNGVRLNDGRTDTRRARGISQREAIGIARGEGLRDVRRVSERQRSFRVDGEDRRGRDITVSVDKYSGNVLSVR